MTETAERSPSLSTSPMPPPTLPSSIEDPQLQRNRVRAHLAIAWLNTVVVACISAWLSWNFSTLRVRDQTPLAVLLVFNLGLAVAGWCIIAWQKFPRPSVDPRAMQLRGVWIMSGVVLFQVGLALTSGRFSMLRLGGIVGMAICVGLMWIFYWRGQKTAAK